MDSKLQTDFNTWLDTILKEIDQIPPAWNFNLYEPFSVELIGAKSYHKKDKDWACEAIFTSSDNYSNFELKADNWDHALHLTIDLIGNYFEFGIHKMKLLKSYAVGCGFVDGDLKIVYENPNKKYRTRKTKVTIEQINDLPLFKVCAWLVVQAGYELIDKSVFANDFQKYMVNKKQPTDMELTAMRKLLFESMDKKKIKL